MEYFIEFFLIMSKLLDNIRNQNYSVTNITMIYTHVLLNNRLGVNSPLDI